MKRWKDIKNKGRTPEHIARLDEEIQTDLAEMSLREVREAAGLSQERAAEIMQMTQSELSKLERRQDVRLSTLRRVMHAYGAELEVCAVLGNKRINLHL